MHSLIVSNVHQEPLFTAEQVIKEIEDMLEVNIAWHFLVNLSCYDFKFSQATFLV